MSGGFRTTCPRCNDLQPPGARCRCESCGCVLTIDRAKVQSLTLGLHDATEARRANTKRKVATRGRSLGS